MGRYRQEDRITKKRLVSPMPETLVRAVLCIPRRTTERHARHKAIRALDQERIAWRLPVLGQPLATHLQALQPRTRLQSA